MATTDFERFDGTGDAGSRLSRIRGAVSTLVGATVALALLAALGVWFYRLGVRDAETVPIIRAMADPAKTRPEDPGGTVAPYQGVASYRVAESAPLQAAAVVIAPAPPVPTRDDVAMGTLAPVTAPAPDRSGTATAPRRGEIAADERLAALTPTDAVPAVAAATPPAAAAPAPTEPQAAPAAAAEEAPAEPAVVPGATAYAPGISPAAPPRPADLRARVADAAQAVERDAEALAARAATSNVQIQLAADPSETTIRAQWVKIQDDNKDILRDRTLAVQVTESGGTTWYRLRVGPFRNRDEASAVCQALLARGQDCIVAKNG